MKVKQLFRKAETSGEVSRKKSSGKMICDDESKKLISRWIEDLGYKFKRFPEFLKLVGVESSDIITIINYNSNSVKCTTNGQDFRITLFFGDGIEHASEIGITIDNTTNWYVTVKSPTNDMPIVLFRGEEVKSDNGKELEFYCNPNTYVGTLKINETHILQIELNKFKESSYKKILENKEVLSRYLLTLSYPDPAEVYKEIMNILDFSDEEIYFTHNCSISYVKTSSKTKRMLSTIRTYRGKIVEYAEFIDGMTYHVFNNGNWEFVSSTMKITYEQNRDKSLYSFYVEGNDEDSISVNSAEIINSVKEKIVRLMEYVK